MSTISNISQPTLARTSGKSALAISVAIAALACLLVAPYFFYPTFLMKVMCFALFACAFNLLIGYAGLLSFGHAMFFGGAAYVSAYTSKYLAFPPELAILSGMLFAALLGLVVGMLSIKRHGIYFAMVTLALSQLFFFLCLQIPATGGEDGLQGVPRGVLFGLVNLASDLNLYYVVLAITVLAVSSSSGAPSIPPSANRSRRSATTRIGPFRWAIASNATSWVPSSSRPPLPVLPAPPRPSSFNWRH